MKYAICSDNGALRLASVDRLTCLLRHWTWADEAMHRFEQELAPEWEHEDDLIADHPFGSYYHWCALLCGLSDAALEHGLLSSTTLNEVREDLEATLPRLRACRQLLVVIPASLEDQPRVVELVREEQTLERSRRVHKAFGKALREERLLREIDSLDQ
jgi:transposase-like protein